MPKKDTTKVRGLWERDMGSNIVQNDASLGLMNEGVRGYAVDSKNAEALWVKSEEFVGERF